jgi:DNA-binding response OmpR family regulator
LVADDDTAIVDALQMMLEMEGYDVETTINGETVAKAALAKPDVILLDIWMSGQDGREIAKHLKGQDATKNIPIIMISANRDTEQIARESGANDFLAKPFDITHLINLVEKYTS